MITAVKKSGFMLSLLFCSTMIIAPSHASTVDIFINFDGIDGESTAVGHERWSDVETVQWGVQRVSEGRRGSTVFSDLLWTQTMDKTFPKLFEKTANGSFIPDVDIDFVSSIAGQNLVFFQMNFNNVALTGIGLDGSTSSLPLITGSFAYEEVTVIYTEYDAAGRKKGDVVANWNLVTGGGNAAEVVSLFGLASVGAATTVVPIPAAVWLFGSGLLGLIGVARRKG